MLTIPLRKTIPLATLTAALLFLGHGCAGSFELRPPPNFVELKDDPNYDFRATSADGVILSVRELDNEQEGNKDFWLDAIRNRIRLNGGYALTEETEVRAASGQAGTQLRFGRDQNGTPFTYWVTLFVGEDKLHLVEAGGRKELFDAAQSEVEEAIAGLQIP